MTKKIVKLSFDPIPGAVDGQTCLSIRPPGTWFNRPKYVVFVGGCGVASCDTLADAKKLLRSAAIQYCRREIDKAQHALDHYTKEHMRIMLVGLGKAKKERAR